MLRILHRLSRLAFAITCCLPGLALGDDATSVDPGFVSLFDGKTLDGWTGATKGYTAEDGKIVCQEKGGGNLFTAKEYGDFDLRFEFKLTPGANNGLGIRCPLTGAPHLEGIEVQIIDDSSEKYKNIKEWQHHGSIYGVVPAKQGSLKPVGEWNQEEVIYRGSQVKVIVNGMTIVDADLAKIDKPIDGHEHPGLKRTQGHIGFLGHGAHVEFRNIRIQDLSSKN